MIATKEQRVRDFQRSEMAKSLLFFSSLVLLVCGLSHAALTPMQYWKTNLPNTPMPKSIHDILSPPEEMSASTSSSDLDYSPFTFPLMYYSAATETQLQDKISRAFFFKEKDMFPGANLTMQFKRSIPKVNLLPRRVANIIPFSSAKLPNILSLFSVDPNSKEGTEISDTLQHCEHPAIKDERKYCATSLESMIDFTISTLATNNVKAVATTASKSYSPMQLYTVNGFEKLSDKTLSVYCHAAPYPYVVFYCHSTGSSVREYAVSLTGQDGTQVQATAVCHTDTSEWNPGYLAFHVLKTKPGKFSPVCHLLPFEHVVWFPNEQSF